MTSYTGRTLMSQEPQNLRQKVRKSTSKSSTGWLAYRTLRTLVETAGRVVSVTRGHDIYYKAGARPMIARRQATNGVAGAFALMSAVAGATELVARRSDANGATYGLHKAETSDLASNVIAYAITLPLMVRELKTGTSLVRKHPTSAYGKATTVTALIGSTYMVALCGRELYARRDEVAHETRELWEDAKFALKRKFGREPELDIEKLLGEDWVKDLLDSMEQPKKS